MRITGSGALAVCLASCATPSAPSASAKPTPIQAPSASSSASLPIAAASLSTAPSSSSPSSSSPVPNEHDGFISQHWIGGDPNNYACTRHAQCYLAPVEKPAAPAAPPFTMCPERKLGMPLEPEYTRKLRKEQGFAACCYLARTCKLPLPED